MNKAVDTSKMKFPMEAVGNVTVGTVEYASGDIFDAESANVCNYLALTDFAKRLPHPPQQGEVAAEVVETKASRTRPADTQETPNTTAPQGTKDGNQVQPRAASAVVRRERRRQ